MGKKEEQLKVLEMMNDARKDLEVKYEKYKSLHEFETDPEEKKHLEKEMGTVQVQLDYVKGAIENCELQLKKVKDKEEQKKIENVMKGVMLVGAYNENKRIIAEKEKAMDEEVDIVRDFHAVVHERARTIFTRKKFRYVDETKVDQILKNEEFKKMAAEDPYKLKRDEKDVQQEYENTIIRALNYINEEIGDDFAENEEKFKKFMSVVNGYERAYKLLKDDPRFDDSAKDASYYAGKRKTYTKDLEQYGTEEDKKFFEELLTDIDDLAIETRDLQNEFLIGRSNFINGNGYTKELIEKEKKVLDKIGTYRDKKNAQMLKDVQEGNDPTASAKMFSLALEFVFPISQQLERDSVMQKNNELREKMEMWYIYEKLPKEGVMTIKKRNKKVENEVKAWSKLKRMKRMAAGNGDIMQSVCDWAVEDAAFLLARVKSPDPITKADEKDIKKKIAAIVLCKVINDEMTKKIDGPSSYWDQIRNDFNREKFDELAGKLMETKEFKNSLKQFMKKGDIRDNTIKFLAEDFEANIAKEFTGKNAEHRRMSMVVDDGSRRPSQVSRKQSVAKESGRSSASDDYDMIRRPTELVRMSQKLPNKK